MSDRRLSARQINRSVLARQLLLTRVDLSIPATLQHVGGLQTQYAPSGYIGLWSRLRDFERASLTRALEDRSVVQATLMRGTIHMVAADDFWPICAAIRSSRREWWLRIAKGEAAASDLARRVADVLRDALGDGPTAKQGVGRGDRARRFRQALLGRRRSVARHGEGASVGNVGASPSRSVRSSPISGYLRSRMQNRMDCGCC